MNTRFPILSFVAKCLKFIGWIVVILGFGYLIWVGFALNKYGHRFNLLDFITIAQGIGIIISGLFIAAHGEMIGVFFAIEENTRNTYKAITSINSILPKPSEEKTQEQLSNLSPEEMYHKGICPNCGAKIDENSVRCQECNENLFDYAQLAYQTSKNEK